MLALLKVGLIIWTWCGKQPTVEVKYYTAILRKAEKKKQHKKNLPSNEPGQGREEQFLSPLLTVGNVDPLFSTTVVWSAIVLTQDLHPPTKNRPSSLG